MRRPSARGPATRDVEASAPRRKSRRNKDGRFTQLDRGEDDDNEGDDGIDKIIGAPNSHSNTRRVRRKRRNRRSRKTNSTTVVPSQRIRPTTRQSVPQVHGHFDRVFVSRERRLALPLDSLADDLQLLLPLLLLHLQVSEISDRF